MHYFWHSVVLILSGIILLRIAGRKSISQMTHTQTIVMISIGTLIVQPIVENSVIKAIAASTIFVVTILLLEYLQLKWDFFENIVTGKAKVVIKDGVLQRHTLKQLRLTIDQMEMRLRNKGIAKIEDIKTATIEPNGDIGYEMQGDAKPLTVGEFKKLMKKYFPMVNKQIENEENLHHSIETRENIFEEIDK
ncbi:DUF421 domain-containing protein [Niallia sp. NCCP-28]|uniref:DUF421 domain-containing protein n=1 Tax=Niallia sp. NCCP-28 TaxID=2934712 RepID=UPI00207DFEA8|nr:DUF421 domain-containing protein [Niallia sp. NCCP-28]GKU81495.1 DUF421 domain-containing protein [Niallia sp. NCCP-28]